MIRTLVLERSLCKLCLCLGHSIHTSSPGQEQKKYWPAFVTRLLTPRSRKSGYGLLLGCRSSGFDGGHDEKTFFNAFPPQKKVKSSSDGRAHLRNRSGVVDLVGREPLIIARVENGVTKFSPQRQKTQKKSKRKLDQENSFPWGILIFLAAGKLTFLGWGYHFKTG